MYISGVRLSGGDRAKPSLSAIVEMLLRKGIKAYYAEDKK